MFRRQIPTVMGGWYILARYRYGIAAGKLRVVPVKGWHDIYMLKQDGVIL